MSLGSEVAFYVVEGLRLDIRINRNPGKPVCSPLKELFRGAVGQYEGGSLLSRTHEACKRRVRPDGERTQYMLVRELHFGLNYSG